MDGCLIVFLFNGNSVNFVLIFFLLFIGVITTTAELDYEALAPSQAYNLQITLSDGPKSTQATLTIKVVDVNEPHVLDGLPARVDLNAASTPGTFLVRLYSAPQ